MYRRALFTVLLSLALASATNAELVGWWKFDETSGDTVFDSSGNGNDGTITGTTQWEPDGMRGGALAFDGSQSYVTIPNGGDLTLINKGDFTITMWFKQDVVTGIANLLQQTDVGGTGRTLLLADAATGIRTFLGGTSTVSDVIEEEGVWYHVAMVVTEEGATDTVHFYIDGQATGTPAAVPSEDCEGDYLIGTDKGLAGRWITGLVDDLRLYNHALSDVEVLAAMEGSAGGYPLASSPNPADGVLLEATWANISWRAGDSAVSHDVYIGENFDDVNDGVAASFQGNQSGTSMVVGFPGFPLPGGLIPGTTYYWRIDEVNDADPNSPWKGNVWSFTVPPKKAYSPTPADGAKFVDTAAALSWTTGFGTKLNHVYFGDNLDDVSNAEGAPGQLDTTYVPGALEVDKTYYWRVDEFDGIETHKGDVWSFATVPDVAVTDTNLTLWWTLDEGVGATAVDWSGHGNHGSIVGDAQWADGYQGTALTFAGTAHVEVAGYEGITGVAPRTCCAWIKTSTAGNYNIMSWGQNTAGQKWRMRINDTGGLRVEVNGGYHYGMTNIGDGLWHHVAVTFEDDGSPDVLDTLLYVDGQLDATSASLDEPIDTASGPVRIG
ncbi:MAG: LamG domain-containing protein, partial [Planctomycetota bacterium]